MLKKKKREEEEEEQDVEPETSVIFKTKLFPTEWLLILFMLDLDITSKWVMPVIIVWRIFLW